MSGTVPGTSVPWSAVQSAGAAAGASAGAGEGSSAGAAAGALAGADAAQPFAEAAAISEGIALDAADLARESEIVVTAARSEVVQKAAAVETARVQVATNAAGAAESERVAREAVETIDVVVDEKVGYVQEQVDVIAPKIYAVPRAPATYVPAPGALPYDLQGFSEYAVNVAFWGKDLASGGTSAEGKALGEAWQQLLDHCLALDQRALCIELDPGHYNRPKGSPNLWIPRSFDQKFETVVIKPRSGIGSAVMEGQNYEDGLFDIYADNAVVDGFTVINTDPGHYWTGTWIDREGDPVNANSRGAAIRWKNTKQSRAYNCELEGWFNGFSKQMRRDQYNDGVTRQGTFDLANIVTRRCDFGVVGQQLDGCNIVNYTNWETTGAYTRQNPDGTMHYLPQHAIYATGGPPIPEDRRSQLFRITGFTDHGNEYAESIKLKDISGCALHGLLIEGCARGLSINNSNVVEGDGIIIRKMVMTKQTNPLDTQRHALGVDGRDIHIKGLQIEVDLNDVAGLVIKADSDINYPTERIRVEGSIRTTRTSNLRAEAFIGTDGAAVRDVDLRLDIVRRGAPGVVVDIRGGPADAPGSVTDCDVRLGRVTAPAGSTLLSWRSVCERNRLIFDPARVVIGDGGTYPVTDLGVDNHLLLQGSVARQRVYALGASPGAAALGEGATMTALNADGVVTLYVSRRGVWVALVTTDELAAALAGPGPDSGSLGGTVGHGGGMVVSDPSYRLPALISDPGRNRYAIRANDPAQPGGGRYLVKPRAI